MRGCLVDRVRAVLCAVCCAACCTPSRVRWTCEDFRQSRSNLVAGQVRQFAGAEQRPGDGSVIFSDFPLPLSGQTRAAAAVKSKSCASSLTTSTREEMTSNRTRVPDPL